MIDMRDANHSWMCIVHIFQFFCNNLKFAQPIQFGPINTTIVRDMILLSNVFNSGIWVLAWLNIIYTKSMGFHLLLKIFHFHLQLQFDENMKMGLSSESTIVEFKANNKTLQPVKHASSINIFPLTVYSYKYWPRTLSPQAIMYNVRPIGS